MTLGRTIVRALAAVAVVVSLTGIVASARAGEHEDIIEKVKDAKTAADHEAIAAYYDKEAAAARQEAAKHREMAATYKAGGLSIGKGAGDVPLPQHCLNLAKDYDEAAQNYSALAAAHRVLAKSVK